MHGHRWVHLLIVIIAAALAVAIAGVPTLHRDTPVHLPPVPSTIAPNPPSTTG